MIPYREHGPAGEAVFVLHGGPGAPGSALGLARALAARGFRAIEPFQRPSGGGPLTVRGHVEDLARLAELLSPAAPCRLVGHSWGAMLALAFAAEYPDRARDLALVGCGTFDPEARREMGRRLAERAGAGFSFEGLLASLESAFPDPDRRLAEAVRRVRAFYEVDVFPEPPDPWAAVDFRAQEETWRDMLRRQEEGVYPAAFAAIRCPVALFQGEDDPHPGEAIRDGLARVVPQLEYRAFPRCGHDPWRERAARDPFCEALVAWLARRAG